MCSFAAQACCGAGSGLNSVASMAILVGVSKKSERESNIGFNEAATGVGFLIGPMFGSFMYEIGGFAMPLELWVSQYLL